MKYEKTSFNRPRAGLVNYYLSFASKNQCTRWNRIDRRVLWFSIPVVLIFVFCPVGIPIPNGFRITLLSLAVFLLVIPFESFLSKRTRLIAVLKKVSTYSFEIYLVHHVVLQGWNKWFSDVYFRKQELLLLFLLDLLKLSLH